MPIQEFFLNFLESSFAILPAFLPVEDPLDFIAYTFQLCSHLCLKLTRSSAIMTLHLRTSLSFVGFQWLHRILDVNFNLLFATLGKFRLLSVQLQLCKRGVVHEAAFDEMLDAVEVIHRLRNNAVLDILVGVPTFLR
jgi:hypothetical protein